MTIDYSQDPPWPMRWGFIQPIPDEADDLMVAALRDDAIAWWHQDVPASRIVDGPTATLVTSVAELTAPDPVTGEEVPLPSRAWQVQGLVMPSDTP